MIKKDVVLSPHHDVIAGDVVYPVVQLSFDVRLALLPTMVTDTQVGLKQRSTSLLGREKDLRVDMPYTYLLHGM